MTGWVEEIDSSKVSVLPPALIAVLLAYAKWQGQQYAVKYGGYAALILVPFVAVRAIPIDNFPTFGLVFFCFTVAGAIAVKHIPWRGHLDRAKTLFVGGFLFAVVPWLMLETLGAAETPRPVAWVFLSAFGLCMLLSLLLFVLDDIRRTFVIVASVLITVLIVIGILCLLTLSGLDESRPIVAQVIAYTALVVATVALTVFLLVKYTASEEPGEPSAAD